MALIEHLERDGWEEFFRGSFRYALEVMKHDRFRSVGSSRGRSEKLACQGRSRQGQGASRHADGNAPVQPIPKGGSQRLP